MRRLLLLLIVLCCSGDVFDAQVRLRFLSSVSAPESPTSPSPAHSATSVSVSPTLTCTSSGATSFTIKFGTDTPPTNIANGTSLGGSCSYVPATLSYSTVYYWQITATNGGGSTQGSIWSFTTMADPGNVPDGSHPRLFLTSAKLTELIAKKDAVHADYTAMKTYVDTYMPTDIDVNTSLSSSLDASATSFSVVDGSVLPTSSISIRISNELITCTTRVSNALSVCTRGVTNNFGHATAARSHSSGATVWKHVNGSGFVEITGMSALLIQLGVTGYETKFRGCLNMLVMYSSAGSQELSLDWIRWYWPNIALGYDWGYSVLTADEKSVYVAIMEDTVNHHLNDQYLPKTWYAKTIGRQSLIESGMFANIAAGQLRSELMLTAAIYGDHASAPAHWVAAMADVTDYLTPAVTTGNAARGVSIEGTEYNAESWPFMFDIYYLLAGALDDASYLDIVDDFAPYFAKYMMYVTTPGSSNSTTTTTGTISSASNSLVVASATGWAVGDPLRINLGASPWVLETYITGISGTTFTLRDAAKAAATTQTVAHISRQIGEWADALEANDTNLYIDSQIWQGHVGAMYHALDRLKTTDAPVAENIRYWLTNVAPAVIIEDIRKKFMWNDSTVTATDWRSTYPLFFASGGTTNTGWLTGRSDWTNSATIVAFLPGHEFWDHTHSDWNSYQIRRKNVPISEEIPGYAVTPFPGPWANPSSPYQQVEEGKNRGARYHNTILMNNHGGANGNSSVQNESPTVPNAFMARYHIGSDFIYGRGDASVAYQGAWYESRYAGSPAPYGANNAQTYVRDFLYLQPDLVVIADRVGYTASATSQTQWNVQFRGNPSVTSQDITSTFAGQSIAHKFLVPESATFAEIDVVAAEYADLADWPTPTAYRFEVVTGVSQSTEYSLQFIRTGDSGFSPCTPSLLTTTNANIGQCGTTVAGAVKGTSVTLDITYVVTGTPRHLLMGFAASTAYHITRSVNTITIAVATGSGDTTANAAGVLDFTL